MPKNIILCSDGTGNSGGKGNNTNVWRVYLAVDHQPAGTDVKQVAFYDDGVGSQDYKVLKMIGGAFGWGISENLRDLYAFLMLHYEPGDKLFLFGFSRGAFTIRTLGNMIRYCGVAQCDGMSVSGINQRAADALHAYKRRDPKHRDASKKLTGGPALEKFKSDFGQYCDDAKTSRDVPIHFIGVWDTVEALGLPIDEMKHGLDWFFGLQFHDGENDLNPLLHNAYHALSIDDERLTFHPVLWDENLKTPEQIVEQVWFPGVHANVGGGYPKDQLSLVALDWMMHKAAECGLCFHQSIWGEYQRDADVDGQLYDSRAGLNQYYRYAPRDVQKISDLANVKVRKVHASVLQRIYNATDDYAPAGLPAEFEVVPAGIAPEETNKQARHHQLKVVRDVVWWRKLLQYVFMTWTAALVGFCAYYANGEKVPDYGGWSEARRGLYYCLNPLVDLAAMITPAALSPYLNALRHYPYVSLALLLSFGLIAAFNRKLINQVQSLSVRAWHMSVGMHLPEKKAEVTPRTWWIKISHWFRHNWASVALDRATKRGERWIAPKITVAAVFVGVPALLAGAGISLGSLVLNPAPEQSVDATKDKVEFLFDTRNSMQATPALLERNHRYRVTVKVVDEWFDHTHPAGVDGLKNEPSAVMNWFGWTRRDPALPWFRLMGVVDSEPEWVYEVDSGVVIEPGRDGRLFLYVNDTFGCYYNNKGTAKITVKCLTGKK